MQPAHAVIGGGTTFTMAGAVLCSISFGHSDKLLGVGQTVSIVGAVIVAVAAASVFSARVQRPTADAYAEGYDTGYTNGMAAGRRIARPVVVPLTRHRCDCPQGSEAKAGRSSLLGN